MEPITGELRGRTPHDRPGVPLPNSPQHAKSPRVPLGDHILSIAAGRAAITYSATEPTQNAETLRCLGFEADESTQSVKPNLTRHDTPPLAGRTLASRRARSVQLLPLLATVLMIMLGTACSTETSDGGTGKNEAQHFFTSRGELTCKP